MFRPSTRPKVENPPFPLRDPYSWIYQHNTISAQQFDDHPKRSVHTHGSAAHSKTCCSFLRRILVSLACRLYKADGDNRPIFLFIFLFYLFVFMKGFSVDASYLQADVKNAENPRLSRTRVPSYRPFGLLTSYLICDVFKCRIYLQLLIFMLSVSNDAVRLI